MNRKKSIRCLLLLLVLMSFRSSVYAQEAKDTLFYFSAVKVKGIYRTFDEFRRNAPSIPLPDGVAVQYDSEETLYQPALPIARLNADSMPCKKKTPIWGFCDGTSVFISRAPGFYKNNTYDKVKYIGRYMYYQYILKAAGSANNTGPGASSGGYVMGGARSRTVVDKGIDINTGEAFELSNQKILKILKDDSVLWNEYSNHKHKEKVQAAYLIKYAEKHKEQIKTTYR